MKQEFYFQSKAGETQIHAVEWIPEGKVKAVLQICHGMVEHIERYDGFARFLAKNEIYVVGNDHLGHGKSVTEKDPVKPRVKRTVLRVGVNFQNTLPSEYTPMVNVAVCTVAYVLTPSMFSGD